MTVYSALTQRLNRLIKNTPPAAEDSHAASSLFKVRCCTPIKAHAS
jgi:hypothetical protein